LGAAAAGGTPPAALAMTLARAADYVLNLELSAMQNEKKGQILANPRVMTSDRKPATITSGQKIQLTTPGQGTNPPTQVLVDANLKLTVTPQITPDGSIITELNISNDTPTTSGGIDVKNITTTVQINDGETIVLGGVYQTTEGSTFNKIPFFGDLPGVGFLFRNSNDTKASNELLFFITPKIVKQSLSVR
jgi:type IV pilus assembly protein PilQ